MKRFSKILAFILTACLLCGLIVTAVFANTDPAYVHPTLTNSAAKNVINHSFESDNLGAYAAHSRISTTRVLGSSLKIKEQSVNGVSNKFFTFSLPQNSANAFLTGSYLVNQRSSYLQFRPNNKYATPEYYFGVYDADTSDSIIPVTSNFDYMTIDFDFSAQGARVEYSDGTYGRATSVTKAADGSVTVILEDGTTVVTNADQTSTTATASDGTVTLWINEDDGSVTKTVTNADGSSVESNAYVDTDGIAYKTVWVKDSEGEVISEYSLDRSVIDANGNYTVTYDSGKTVKYSYSKDTTSGTVITESYTVTDGDDITVYTLIDSTDSAKKQTITYRKTVNGEVASENVSSFPYSSGSVSHTNASYVATFNAEWAALEAELSSEDTEGKHIADTRAAYTDISMYNTFRWYDSSNTYKTASNNFYAIGYLNGSWGIFREGSKNEIYRIFTLPDEIGVWTHITIIIESDNTTWTESKAHFLCNGELLDTYVLSELKGVSSYAWMSIEDWRMTVSDVLPKGDANYFSLGFDNLTINAYTPTTTLNAEGTGYDRVAYSSGEAYGIDDFLAQETVSGNLADCKDTVYSPNYMLPYDNAYTVMDGVKYYVPGYVTDKVNATAENGSVFETNLGLTDLTVPEGIKGYEIICPDYAVCTLSAEAQKYATIEKTDTGYKVYRTYIYGTDYKYYSGNNNSGGSNGASYYAPTYSTLQSVTYGGNSYTQYAYKADAAERYRYDFAIGSYNSKDVTVGYHGRDYSYFTVDFDIFADKYVYVDGVGAQVLTDDISTIPEGTEYKLAYLEGTNIALDLRTIASADATSYGSTFPHTIYFKYADGDWTVWNGGTNTGHVLSRNIYDFNHFTIAAKLEIVNDKVLASTRLYLNGELIATNSVNLYDFTIRAMDWYNTNVNGTDYGAIKYSMGIDNLTANYYSKGYTSGDMNGVDDLFSDGATNLVDYIGVAYDAEYPYPAYNSYVQIGSGEKIYNPVLAKRAVESAPSGSAITSTKALYEINPNGEFILTSPNNSPLTITEEASHVYVFIESTQSGAATYTVRLPGEDDKLILNWVDSEGNLFATEELLLNDSADATNKNGSLIDIDAMTAVTVSGWYWDLDGEGSEYSESAIGKFAVKDVAKIGGNTVTVYPKTVSHDISGAFYVAYVNADGIIRLADYTVTNFKNAAGITETLKTCPDGTVIKFVFSADSTVLPTDTYYSYSGMAVTFDLNGKTVTRYNNSAYGQALIRIGEGATCTVTSTVPGARIFLASKRNSTVEGNSNNRIFGADGIVQTLQKVDSAHIEISNLEFNGGTMVKFDGLLSEDVAPKWENDVPITCKIDNVKGYAPNRSSYAVIATLCPDVEVEITNSIFYVPDASYSFVHDYAKDGAKIYRSETDLTIKNSEILCYTEGDSPKMGKFWYTMGANSSLYVENSRIIAKLNVSASKATYGPGCEIATDKTAYFAASSVVSGVLYKTNTNSAAKIDISFTRAAFTTNWSYVDATNGKYIDSAYTDTVSITRGDTLTFVTYTADNLPDSVGKIEWQDQNGAVIGTDYGFVGLTATAPKSMSDLGIENVVYDWYSTVYNWGDTVSGDTVIKEGENIFIPIASESVHINGKKANISLTTGMIFNLYIPLPGEGVQADSVSSPDVISPIEKTKVNGTDMLKLSFASELEEFAPNVITIYFVTTDGEALSYDVEIDELKYVTLLANSVECSSEEAQLAYEIIAYKKAVASYLASAEGKTLLEVLTESELSAIAAFEAVFTSHASGCVCTSGLYSEDAVGSTEMPTSTYVAVGISGFAYLLQSDENGLRINMSGDVESTIKHVSYKDLLGIERVHDAALDNLNFVETESGGYYVVSGINASDITAAFTITLDVSGTEKTVTYSLAQYINSTDADVAKALYSYSMAARAYKAITESEQ